MDSEIKNYDELVVGLSKDNMTILGLARKLSSGIRRAPIPPAGPAREAWASAQRERLAALVRFRAASVSHAWALKNTKEKGLETRSHRLEMSNGLSATGVWLKAITAPEGSPMTLVLHDGGKKASQDEISDRVNRGEQVLALDLLLSGDVSPAPAAWHFAEMLATTGDRPLGIQAAQLVAAANWLRESAGGSRPRLECNGIRSQLAALVAAALHPGFFSSVTVREGMSSLAYLLESPIAYQSAPALFCLDLLKEFDIDSLAALAGPTSVAQKFVEKPLQ